MSNNNIRFMLNLKDKNITFGDGFYSKTSNGITYKDYPALIDQHFTICDNCNHKLIKYGTKASYIRMPDNFLYPTRLYVKKKRYQCPSCHKIYTSQSRELVNPNCSISNAVKIGIANTLFTDSSRILRV